MLGEVELVAAFGQDYVVHAANSEGRNLADGMTVYYLRRELQALVDMWRATGNLSYLDCATDLTLEAIDAATANSRPLIWHEEVRGQWPCFYLSTVESETGGHNQLCDFQGAVGFMLVARALRQVNDPTARDIAAFVHSDIIEKWLYYKPSMTPWHMQNDNSFDNVLAALNTGRDVREHFACLCLDLNRLGFRKYAYRTWAKRLLDLYLTVRYDPNEPAPDSEGIEDLIPDDWGLFAQQADEGYTWLLIPDYAGDGSTAGIDTSHGNRTAWLAARAYSEGLLDADVLYGLINTLEFRIWAPEKGLFYFNNFTDGSDGEFDGLASGRGGNVWFGWHRLATYNEKLEALFIALAVDLAAGGPNLPDNAQNKTMANAPLCLEAWGARLLSAEGRPHVFP
ncbi:MAG: hypothetical protein JSW27_09345 [Phycisphaerales bacterium]|nr:MAG: hypothetical protein JSW27_09345 [Phycisphaerales bacterium]